MLTCAVSIFFFKIDEFWEIVDILLQNDTAAATWVVRTPWDFAQAPLIDELKPARKRLNDMYKTFLRGKGKNSCYRFMRGGLFPKLRMVVLSPKFRTCITLTILFSSIFTALDTIASYTCLTGEIKITLSTLELIFAIIFMLEMLVKHLAQHIHQHTLQAIYTSQT